jgi:hypothetical protein
MLCNNALVPSLEDSVRSRSVKMHRYHYRKLVLRSRASETLVHAVEQVRYMRLSIVVSPQVVYIHANTVVRYSTFQLLEELLETVHSRLHKFALEDSPCLRGKSSR